MFYASRTLTPEDFPCPVFALDSDPDGKLSALRIINRMRHLIAQHKPHIVQTFFTDGKFLGTSAARIARVPVIVSSQRNTSYWRTSRHRALLRIVNRWVTSWQCNSRAVYADLQQNEGISSEHIEILPNAIPTSCFVPPTPIDRASARGRLGLAADEIVFVCVANLRAIKDLSTLVKAAKLVVAQLSAARFLLVGEGEMQDSLNELIKETGLTSSVRLIGTQADIRTYLAAADIGVQTSLSEGSSNAVLEYMAMGLPAVVSNIPANLELVPEVSFQVGKPEDLAQKLLWLWNRPDVRATLSKNYRTRAEQYSVEAFVERAQGYYARLVAEYLEESN